MSNDKWRVMSSYEYITIVFPSLRLSKITSFELSVLAGEEKERSIKLRTYDFL